jgi:hypothetical protein
MQAKDVIARMRMTRDNLQSKKSQCIKDKEMLDQKIAVLTEDIEEIDTALRECESALEEKEKEKGKNRTEEPV